MLILNELDFLVEVRKMAKAFTCPVCGAEPVADRETELVEIVQSHAQSEHDLELEEEEIRQGISDT